jgi:hypothetical protein
MLFESKKMRLAVEETSQRQAQNGFEIVINL